VAIDQASVDLVNQEAALPESSLNINRAAGEDKFRGIYPQVDWAHQLDYAEQLGSGAGRIHWRKFKLIASNQPVEINGRSFA